MITVHPKGDFFMAEQEQFSGQSQKESFYVDPSRVGRGTIFYVHTDFKGENGVHFRLIVRNIAETEGQRFFYLVELPHPVIISSDEKPTIVHEVSEADLANGRSEIVVFDKALNLMKESAAVAFPPSK